MGWFTLLCVSVCAIIFCTSAVWSAPQTSKKIIFIASDLNNGGVVGVKKGFLEAIRELTWEVEIKDGAGNLAELRRILKESLDAKPDGIVLGGFQPELALEPLIRASSTVVVGWHAGVRPGRTKTLFANITTEPSEVAKLAADSVQKVGSKTPGVVIISDDQFAIANEKVRQISESLKKCKRCRILSVENVPIAKAPADVTDLVIRLNRKFGKDWTHTIAINDVYFDHMNFPLREIHRRDIANIGAGDGSDVALSRIKGGGSQQVVTVAEPLLAQGWQVVDEFNRAFSGKKESGSISKPILITKEILEASGTGGIESQVSIRETYLESWKR